MIKLTSAAILKLAEVNTHQLTYALLIIRTQRCYRGLAVGGGRARAYSTASR